jgi:hypothetical protein
VALGPQQPLQAAEHLGLVVDEQDALHAAASRVLTAPITGKRK